MSRASLAAKLRSLANDLEALDRFDDVGATSVLIDHWALARRAVPCLIGCPTGHPAIEDGSPQVSSELFYLDEERGFARTLSRWYRLGTPLRPTHWN
jgi:hypothetical protein